MGRARVFRPFAKQRDRKRVLAIFFRAVQAIPAAQCGAFRGRDKVAEPSRLRMERKVLAADRRGAAFFFLCSLVKARLGERGARAENKRRRCDGCCCCCMRSWQGARARRLPQAAGLLRWRKGIGICRGRAEPCAKVWRVLELTVLDTVSSLPQWRRRGDGCLVTSGDRSLMAFVYTISAAHNLAAQFLIDAARALVRC